ncbi:MAG: ferritin-like domain-containing protein, partial [Myxococcales bacterium]|nr:ferritin-like domain-containing protein [Myxococcales bacterium]
MDPIRLWTVIYYAERLGAGSYWRLAQHMPSDETRATMREFGDDERMHARWFATELEGRGRREPARGDWAERAGAALARSLVAVLGRRGALKAMHTGERRALADLYKLIDHARD